MTKLGLLLAATGLLACQQDTKTIERKLDQIIAKLDKLPAGGGGAGPAAGAAAQRPPRPEPDRAKTYAIPVDGDPFIGPADAKVTLVKAYDYACPYCEKVRGTMDDLHKKYGNDLRIVYKQLVVHPRNAMASALAFCAAAKQGKAEQMNNLLWDKGFKARQMDMSDVAAAGGQQQAQAEKAGPQKCWDTADGCKFVVGFAQELQLDVAKFKSDMKGECVQQVQKDMKDLSQFSVNATPGFFVNGRFLSGAQPLDSFIALIDEELKKANERGGGANYYQTWVIDKGLKSLAGK